MPPPKPSVALRVAALGAAQCGVASRSQLRALGVDRHAIRNQVSAGRWRWAGPHLVALHNSGLTERQRLWAAVLAAGPPAVVCGLTAAALGGLTGFPSRVVHVLVPHGTHLPSRPALAAVGPVKVHVSRRFDPTRDVHSAGRPPRTRMARSVIDAATWSDGDVRACALLAAAVQQRLVTVDHLREELAAAGAVRRRRLLSDALGDIEGGAHSFAELEIGRIFRRFGLPPPTRQTVREDPGGRRRYLDLFWPNHGLCVEVDGGFHWDERQWRRDLERQNDLVADGIRVMRVPGILMRADQARALAPIARALGRPLPPGLVAPARVPAPAGVTNSDQAGMSGG